jgi:hypothetical protein
MADYSLTDSGLTVPTMVELLKALDNDFIEPDNFGNEVDLTPDSPLYKISRPIARQLALCWQGLRDWSAQLDSQTAFGQGLDYLGSLIGVTRIAATRSTLVGRAVGAPGENVNALSILRYTPGASLWQVIETQVIGAGGFVDVEIEALEFGPVDAPQAVAADWEIVTGQTPGWYTFESTSQATLGQPAESDVDYRARLAEASRGLATYDAIVRELRAVDNVAAVYLYINLGLAYDPIKKLFGKQMRPVVQGGSKTNIIAALHRSVGAPVETVGAVTGTYNPGNGQILDYAFDRLARRRGYLKITITGGNPQIPLPTNAAALALAATATVVPQGGQPFSPYIYGQAAVEVLPKGSVTKMKAEGRLDPGDPWEEDALVLELNEIIDISTEPTVAVATAIEEDDISIGIGDDFNYTINGGVPQSYVFVAATTSSATAAAAINAAASEPVVIGSIDGRVVMRTVLKGSAASIQIDAGVASSYLFAGEPLFTGSDGDVEIVIL